MAAKKTKVTKQGATATKNPLADLWRTPDYILRLVDRFYEGCNRWHDPCPAGPIVNAFSYLWNHPRMFVNPPFSEYLKWVNHALNSLEAYPDLEMIWICHHSHETKWFKALLEKASAMILIDHRVRFVDPSTGKQSPSSAIGKCQTLIYIGNKPLSFLEIFKEVGHGVQLKSQLHTMPTPPAGSGLCYIAVPMEFLSFYKSAPEKITAGASFKKMPNHYPSEYLASLLGPDIGDRTPLPRMGTALPVIRKYRS